MTVGAAIAQGIMKWAEGGTYSGQWLNDVPHGIGKLIIASCASLANISLYAGTQTETLASGFTEVKRDYSITDVTLKACYM